MEIDEYALSREDEKDCEGFAALFDSQSDEVAATSESSLVKGRIIKIQDDEVMVDVGQKSERKMNINEIKDESGNLLFKEGDELDLLVGRAISHKQALRKLKFNEAIKDISEDEYKGKVIDVVVVDKNKGGYIVKWIEKDIECFLPNSHSAIKHNSPAPTKAFKVCITRIDKDEIRVSRKKYFDVSNKNKEEEIEKILKLEAPIKGEITSITNFGIFVSINGVEGLVHTTEVSYKKVNPASLYKVGDVVLVKVLNYDSKKSKLSLSMKALNEDPWNSIEDTLKVGYVVKVAVSNIQPYGVFVDAGGDIEGFLHITEMSWEKNIKKPESILKVGDEIDVEIIELDASKKRLRVSLKKMQDKPFVRFAKNYKVGDVLKGKIATLTDFGAFVRFEYIDGLLHNEDLSWDKQKRCKDTFKVGDEVEVKILKIDKESEKISLSRKAILESPVSEFAKSHKVGDVVSGKVVEIKEFGVFIKLTDFVDALIKNEDLSPLKKDEIKMGDNIEASIANIDLGSNKVRLSVKKLSRKKEQDEIKNYSNDEKMTLGDILKDKMK